MRRTIRADNAVRGGRDIGRDGKVPCDRALASIHRRPERRLIDAIGLLVTEDVILFDGGLAIGIVVQGRPQFQGFHLLIGMQHDLVAAEG